MRIVFLDFDGVLNRGSGPFEPELVKRLNKITNMASAKIVVHSSWRYGRTLDELREILTNAGVTGKVIDAAPVPASAVRGESGIIVLDSEDFARFTRDMPTRHDYERPAAIQRWLDDHQDVGPQDFVILDDCGFMAHLAARHVRTRQNLGLSEGDMVHALRLLRRIAW